MIIASLFPYNHIIYKIKNKHHNLKDQKGSSHAHINVKD